MSDPNGLNVGSVVSLKSGGPPMTVESLQECSLIVGEKPRWAATCVYFVKRGTMDLPEGPEDLWESRPVTMRVEDTDVLELAIGAGEG